MSLRFKLDENLSPTIAGLLTGAGYNARITNQAPGHQMEVVSRILPSLSGSSLQGQLWIIEDSRMRIRE